MFIIYTLKKIEAILQRERAVGTIEDVSHRAVEPNFPTAPAYRIRGSVTTAFRRHSWNRRPDVPGVVASIDPGGTWGGLGVSSPHGQIRAGRKPSVHGEETCGFPGSAPAENDRVSGTPRLPKGAGSVRPRSERRP